MLHKQWKEEVGLDWRDNMIIGDGLKKDILKFYSNKFYTMINYIQESIRKEKRKNIYIS